MRLISSTLLLILLVAEATLAQECGPSCPVCSGAGNNDGALLSPGSVMASAMGIPTAEDERAVLTVRLGILSWLDAGIGYAVQSEKLLWSLRTQPIAEREGGWRPGLILGTGSVQIGGSDQSGYAQLIKSWEISETLGLRFSAGAATLMPDLDETFGLAGITASLVERYAVFADYDGKSFHEGVSWIPLDWLSLSFLMVETEFPTVSIVFKRSFWDVLGDS